MYLSNTDSMFAMCSVQNPKLIWINTDFTCTRTDSY